MASSGIVRGETGAIESVTQVVTERVTQREKGGFRAFWAVFKVERVKFYLYVLGG